MLGRFLLIACVIPLQAQVDVRVHANLVLVPVTVCDSSYRPVINLTREQFRLYDDGVEQTIRQFAKEDEPLAVGLVFDTSRSMARKLASSRLAVDAFFERANPEDEFFLVEFNEQARVVTPLTSDIHSIPDRVMTAAPMGRTALLDAIYLSLNELRKSAKHRKALVIVSDGGDNASRYTQLEVMRLVQESDAAIYAIGVFDSYAGRHRPPEEADGPALLRRIAEQSGGRMIPVIDRVRIPYIAVKIGIELRNRYVLGYSPAQPRQDGRYHHVTVKVAQPPAGLPLRAFWRMGYYAPTE